MGTSLANFLLGWAAIGLLQAAAQITPAFPQLNTFNSTATITTQQQQAASLNQSTAAFAQVALRFEQSNWAGQSVSQSFYDVPASAKNAKIGTLLKKEDPTNTTLYTLPPNVALSRFIFQSETVNGTAVPASAYILWPFTPKKFKNVDGVPLVAFAHGNSGYEAECAPSHLRNLYYQYHAPFELALAGYAVVAPDYAGLGVDRDVNGKKITAQWLTNPAGANDLIHAVAAAQQGFNQLSKAYVVMGHSQGGGAAWGAAVRESSQPTAGYLGTVALSPFTDFAGSIAANPMAAFSLGPGIARFLCSIFPSFQKSDFLTPLGIARLNLLDQLQGCNAVSRYLLAANTTLPGLVNNKYFKWFDALSSVGGRDFRGPLLIIQGTGDVVVNAAVTTNSVDQTCKNHPQRKLQYSRYDGPDHVPTLYASRQEWMSFIEDRFRGVVMEPGCKRDTITPLRHSDAYQQEINFFLEFSLYPYENS